MTIELKTAEALGKAFETFTKLNDEKIEKLAKGEAVAELKEQLAKANADMDRLSTEMKAIATAANRSGSAAEQKKTEREEKAAKHAEALKTFMRTGNDVELKALSGTSDPDGGYLLPLEVSSEIVKQIYESSPIAELASHQTISGRELQILVDNDELSAGWVEEKGTRSATATPQLRMLKFGAFEMYAMPSATQQILDDASINLEQWLSEKAQDKFKRLAATGFVSGNGVGQPRGILSYAAGTSFDQVEQANSGAAATIGTDGVAFISLQQKLKDFYQPNACWIMNRATVASVRSLKDLQGRYLWQPGLELGKPDVFLGKPLMYASDMPVEAANALAVAYGDFKQGYQVVDRKGISVLRDPYTNKGSVLFYTTARIGGGVKNFEAIKLLKCHT